MAKIIPVFIPHAGCPHQCVFCNQKTISGQAETSLEQAKKQIIKYLQWLQPSAENEIAFYGGTFTGLSLKLQEDLLSLAESYIVKGIVGSIRISTRPDYIDKERISLLKGHHVNLVELGIQSLDDNVLRIAERGHTAADAENAVVYLKSEGFRVGMQLMVGLPGQDWESIFATVTQVVSLKPDVARIYPLLVIKNTPLETMYRNKLFSPLTLAEGVAQAAYVYERLDVSGIDVIRIGLQADEELCRDNNIVAGPFHPSFGEMVQSFQYRSWVSEQLEEVYGGQCRVGIIHNSRETSKLKGLNKCNEIYWQNNSNGIRVNLLTDDSLSDPEFRVSLLTL
ncbi:MAG: radical SAM protein [Negativicutes bacterium]|nr:radical SAM protein [Negativicutes bacterium]